MAYGKCQICGGKFRVIFIGLFSSYLKSGTWCRNHEKDTNINLTLKC